jgi:hypothetical protein
MRAILTLLIIAATSGLLFAQHDIGTLTGSVSDQSNHVLVAVNVTLTNSSTGSSLTTKSNSAGFYVFPEVKPGTYKAEFSLAGFKSTEIDGLEILVGRSANADIVMQVGSVKEMVVVAANDVIDPTDVNPSSVVEQSTIGDLPLSGRRYTDFILLTPNVTMDGEYGHLSFAGQQGGVLSGYTNTSASASNANGSSQFTVDGANATSYYYGDNRGYTRIPYVFGLQAVEEFQAVPNAYNASYGGASAGLINTVTRSGTNDYHAEAFYYNRNSATGANDAVNKASGFPRPLNILQQFGADFGGPLVKNRLFLYFDYEQQRQNQPLYVAGTTQSSVTEGDFGVPLGTNLPVPNSHFPVASSLSPAQASADPTNPIYLQGVSDALNVIQTNIGARARRRDDIEFFPKLDWQLTSKDHLSLLYNYNRFQSPGGIITFSPEAFAGIEALGDNGVRDHFASVHWVRTLSPATLNDSHVSFVRDEQLYNPSGLVNPQAPLVQLIQPQYFALGNETFSYQNLREYQWDLTDHVTHLHGRHQLEFGFDCNRAQVSDSNPGTFFGQYTFLSLQNFALGKWDVYAQTTGNPQFNFDVPFVGFYVNDTVRLRNLTLSGGLREDFQMFSNPNGNPGLPSSNHIENQYQRLSPRLGFAYQPLQKTVIRGGVGLYYALVTGANYQNSTQANGVDQSSLELTNTGNPNQVPVQQTVVFPNSLPANNHLFTAGTNIAVIAPGFKDPSVTNASIQLEREVLNRTQVSAGTMWSHGVHLTSSTADDLNLLAPAGTTAYIECPTGTAPAATSCTGPTFYGPNLDSGLLHEGRINSQLGQINALISPGINNYVSFFTQVNRQVSNGLTILMAYTLSKTTQSGVDFYNQFDLGDARGLSLQDQRHRLSFASVWRPSSNFETPLLRTLLSNWSVSLVSQFNSGHPYTGLLNPSMNGSYLNDSAALQNTPNSAAGLAGRGPAPAGLNSFTGPWITEIDIGLQRNIRLTERQSIAIKIQGFNILNSANYFVQAGAGINQYQYNPTGTTCGNGTSINQTCYLVPAPGFKTLESISQPNGPRIFQLSFTWRL